MSAPPIETIIAKLRDLSADARNQVDLHRPINPGSMLWLREHFQTKLARPLPPALATMFEAFEGAQIAKIALFDGRGTDGIVDQNLELRVGSDKWKPQWIVFGRLATAPQQNLVLDVDKGDAHISDLHQPRWVKSFPGGLSELLVHVIRDQLGVRARTL
jgi:hypothetical protein